MKSIEIGDIASIYIPQSRGYGTIRNDVGIVTRIWGSKADVLVSGQIENWDISDLKKMASWKNGEKDAAR